MRYPCNTEMHCRCHLALHLDSPFGLFDLCVVTKGSTSTLSDSYGLKDLGDTLQDIVLLSFLRPLYVYSIYSMSGKSPPL